MVHNQLGVPESEVEARDQVVQKVSLRQTVDFPREQVFFHVQVEAIQIDEVAATQEDQQSVENGDDAVFNIQCGFKVCFEFDEMMDDHVGDCPEDRVVEELTQSD
jgi:hypothetical protein